MHIFQFFVAHKVPRPAYNILEFKINLRIMFLKYLTSIYNFGVPQFLSLEKI